MLGDPDFHNLEAPEQRQLLRNAGMGGRSDQELDSLVMAARSYHGMSAGQVMSPISKFLGSAGQAFQGANPVTGHPGEAILHMIGGPDPTTGETTADWARSLPGVSTYENLRQGRIAEELGSWMPSLALGLLTGGLARAPEIAEATGTGAGATWAGLKGAGRAYSTEKTLLPATLLGGALRHFEVPYGAEIGGFLGASPTMGKGFIQGVREYLNPPIKPTEFGPPVPIYGPRTSSTARFAEPLPEARLAPYVPAPTTHAPMGGVEQVPVKPAKAPGYKPAPTTHIPMGGITPAGPEVGPGAAQMGTTGTLGGPVQELTSGTVFQGGQPPVIPGPTGKPMNWGDEMSMFHAEVERLPGDNPYAKGGPAASPAGKKAPGYTSGLVRDLNLTSPEQLRALTNASRAAGRLLTTEEARQAIQNIK